MEEGRVCKMHVRVMSGLVRVFMFCKSTHDLVVGFFEGRLWFGLGKS